MQAVSRFVHSACLGVAPVEDLRVGKGHQEAMVGESVHTQGASRTIFSFCGYLGGTELQPLRTVIKLWWPILGRPLCLPV